ncbi:MAG TPA: ABC transporter permease, partial [Terriglobales bacterium]|nr:ABC transporter permease [Terriglobales bacterium]
PDPQQLVAIDVHTGEVNNGVTLVRYELLRDHNRSFQQVAVYTNDNFNLTGHGEPVQVAVARVSPNFFSLVGVQPQLGRTFTEEEGRPEGRPVVMISDALWRTRFGGDRKVVGQTVNLDSAPNEIIGVAPPGDFPFVGQADIWSPRYFEYTLMSTARLRMGVGYLGGLGRMRPDATLASTNSELEVLNQQYRSQNPAAPDASGKAMMTASPLRDGVVAGARTGVLVLSFAVGMLLLVACLNVAGLLLARALARRKEIAVRTALGARRAVLLRQLLTESVLLSVIAGILGLVLSVGTTRSLVTLGANHLPPGIPIAMDARVLIFSLAVSLLTGLLFGIVPALKLTRTNVNTTLRDEGRGVSAGHGRVQMKNLLVAGQVAFSLVLLIGAGLLVRSFARLLLTDPGIDAHNVLTMNVSLPTVKYAEPPKQIAFFDELLRRVSAQPGVRSAAISAALPLSWKRITPMLPEGQPDVPLPLRPFITVEAVSPQWFRTLGVPLKAGRELSDADNTDAPKVTVVNESFARRFWPNQNPIGKHILIGRQTVPTEVVGVAADIKNRGLASDPQPQLYLPFPQLPWGNMNLIVRTATEPHSMVGQLRAQIAAIDPDQPIMNIRTVEELMQTSRADPRFTMVVLGMLSATALVLAMVGIYGVLAYSVTQRRQELGIRLALGAERSDILRLVVRQGLTLTLAGVGVGLVFAIILSMVFRAKASSLLYKVSAFDLTTFALASLVFAVVALAASYLPARRATKVDPTEALRGT